MGGWVTIDSRPNPHERTRQSAECTATPRELGVHDARAGFGPNKYTPTSVTLEALPPSSDAAALDTNTLVLLFTDLSTSVTPQRSHGLCKQASD